VTEEKITAERLSAFSDAVFAVIVTIMVLELEAPEEATFSALLALWPTAISYALSYLFIAIIWINHHYLMRFAGPPTLRLIWINFAHLFLVSLLPFATAWVARTELASSPVVVYAGLFVCIDIAYNVFKRHILAGADKAELPPRMQRFARRRSLIVLAGFTAATLAAFFEPRVGFGLICAALIFTCDPRFPTLQSTSDKENNKVRVAAIVMSFLLGVCVAGPAGSAETPNATPSPEIPAVDVYRYALQRALKQVSEEELADAYPALLGVIRSPVFDQLTPAEQHWALFVAGLVALDLDKPAAAHPLLVRACAMPDADGDDWVGRLNAARRMDLREDMVLSLTQIARQWPKSLEELIYQVVTETVSYAHYLPGGEAPLHQLLDSLYTARWTFPEKIEPSYMWRDLAALEIDRKQFARAKEVVSRVMSPHVVIGMRIDRRFDRLRASVPKYFDVEAAVKGELATMRAIVQRSPRSLNAIIELTYSQLGAGLYEQTLATTSEVLRKIEAAPSKEPPYDDMDKVIWIYDNRARALARMQRWSEAESEVRSAADRKEDGERNVSNVINLAWFYAEAGRSDEALATLVDLGQTMSKYGLMQMHGVRYAAALQKGDAEIANESLAYLLEHRKDSLDTWQWTLVRANRLDEAAELLIERLRDPVLRSDALYDLQDYGNPPPQAQRAIWNERWRRIRDRPDVREAIDAVGRIEKFRIPSSPS
jgi:uncharacterized membrane protein